MKTITQAVRTVAARVKPQADRPELRYDTADAFRLVAKSALNTMTVAPVGDPREAGRVAADAARRLAAEADVDTAALAEAVAEEWESLAEATAEHRARMAVAADNAAALVAKANVAIAQQVSGDTADAETIALADTLGNMAVVMHPGSWEHVFQSGKLRELIRFMKGEHVHNIAEVKRLQREVIPPHQSW